jgi:hypothetical protein
LPNYAYITVPNTFNFGDSDFTYEWFQNQQQPGPVAIYLGLYDGGESGIIFSSDINSTTSTATITADFSSSGTITSDLPSNILLNTWAHVAVVRILSTITMYVNGNPTDSIRSSAYLNAPFGDIKIGQTQDDIEGIYCNIANFRIINGTGIYTSSFTVPSSPLTNVSNTVLLLSATDSARLNVDSSSQNNSVSTFSVAWSSDTPFS